MMKWIYFLLYIIINVYNMSTFYMIRKKKGIFIVEKSKEKMTYNSNKSYKAPRT